LSPSAPWYDGPTSEENADAKQSGSMDHLFEVALEPPPRGTRRSGAELHTQLRAAILDGRLVPGSQLPVKRQAERFFGVSTNTAARVYERLANEGLVQARRGSGTYVASRRKRPARKPIRARAGDDSRLNPLWLRPDVIAALDFWREAGVPPERANASIDFRPALVDSRMFPFDVLRRVGLHQLRRMEVKPAAFRSPQGNQGHFPLRAAITQHIGVTRTVVCEPDDVLVTAGAQQAFDLLGRVLVSPGATTVAVEDPGYPPMRAAFIAAGARIVPIAVDGEGLVVDSLPETTRVVCVCPSHQFPLGVPMSARRRKALLEYARRRNAVIVEDDYDGEFRFEGTPLQALRSESSDDVVFYVGTFSKCMLPALRLGYIVAPQWAMRTLVTAKNCLDWHCPTLMQMTVARFIAEGHLTRHVRRMREVYRKRRRRVLEILQSDFAGRLTPIASHYGMHVAAFLHSARNPERMTEGLKEANLNLHSFERYFLRSPTSRGLVFGYGAVDLPGIERGFSMLSRAL
jgi:GntR family transcriptional regulator / MocR family aminotransferase